MQPPAVTINSLTRFLHKLARTSFTIRYSGLTAEYYLTNALLRYHNL